MANSDSMEGTSLNARLRREGDVLLGGLKDGVQQAASEAWADKTGSLLKAGGAAVLGVGLAVIQQRVPMLKLATQVATSAMGVAFVADVAGKAGETASAAAAAWQSSEGLDEQRRKVAGALGPFVVDTAIMTGGGLLGAGLSRFDYSKMTRLGSLTHPASIAELTSAKLGSTAVSSDLVPSTIAARVSPSTIVDELTIGKSPELEKAYFNVWPSIAQVLSQKGGRSAANGTAFFISEEGHALTAYHVVAGAERVHLLTPDAKFLEARVLRLNPGADLALLKTESNGVYMGRKLVPFDALRLAFADESLVAGDRITAFGYNSDFRGMAAATGFVSDRAQGLGIIELPATFNRKTQLVESMMDLRSGFSGGPLVRGDGAVVGLNFATSRNEQRGFHVSHAEIAQFLNKSGTGVVPNYYGDRVPMLNAGNSHDWLNHDLYNGLTKGVVNIAHSQLGRARSGFVADARGHIVTSSDVALDKQTHFNVMNNGVWSMRADLVRNFPEQGISVLKVSPYALEREGLTPLQLAPDDLKLRTGQSVAMVGYKISKTEPNLVQGVLGENAVRQQLYKSAELRRGANPSQMMFATNIPTFTGASMDGAAIINRRGLVVGVAEGMYGENQTMNMITARQVSRIVRDL